MTTAAPAYTETDVEIDRKAFALLARFALMPIVPRGITGLFAATMSKVITHPELSSPAVLDDSELQKKLPLPPELFSALADECTDFAQLFQAVAIDSTRRSQFADIPAQVETCASKDLKKTWERLQLLQEGGTKQLLAIYCTIVPA